MKVYSSYNGIVNYHYHEFMDVRTIRYKRYLL